MLSADCVIIIDDEDTIDTQNPLSFRTDDGGGSQITSVSPEGADTIA